VCLEILFCSSFGPVFLAQLLIVIAFLLVEVKLRSPFLSVPYKWLLQKMFPDIYTDDTVVVLHPYFASGLLFVSVTTLLLFFASGMYTDKIAYANQ
jgi:Spo7-like protein